MFFGGPEAPEPLLKAPTFKNVPNFLKNWPKLLKNIHNILFLFQSFSKFPKIFRLKSSGNKLLVFPPDYSNDTSQIIPDIPPAIILEIVPEIRPETIPENCPWHSAQGFFALRAEGGRHPRNATQLSAPEQEVSSHLIDCCVALRGGSLPLRKVQRGNARARHPPRHRASSDHCSQAAAVESRSAQ